MRKCFKSLVTAVLLASGVLSMPTVEAGEIFPAIDVIEQPGQTLMIRSGSSQAIVFYEEIGAFFDLTMLMTGSENEVLRARVQLSDGQGHAMIMNSADGATRDRFTFRRNGGQILVTGAELDTRRAGL